MNKNNKKFAVNLNKDDSLETLLRLGANSLLIYYQKDNLNYYKEKLSTLPNDISISFVVDKIYWNEESFKILKNIFKDRKLEIFADINIGDNLEEYRKLCVEYKYHFSILYPCNNFYDINILKNHHVYTYFITTELLFDLDNVYSMIKTEGEELETNITMILKSKPLINMNEILPYQYPFVLPSHRHIYDFYIDTYMIGVSDQEKNVLLDIYKKDEAWNGNISEITEVPLDINAYFIPDTFAQRRTNCQLACMKGKQCMLCPLFLETSEQIRVNFKNLISQE